MSRIAEKIGYIVLISLLTIVLVILSIYLYGTMMSQQRLEQDVISLQQQITEQPKAEQDRLDPLMEYEACKSGELRYQSRYTPFTFCYPSRFGGIEESESQISPAAREGQEYTITFDRADAVRITLQTTNYRKLGDSDVPPEADPDCLDATKTNEELRACFTDPVVSLEGNILGGLPMYFVTQRIDSIEDSGVPPIERNRVFVPNISEQPALHAIISYPLNDRETIVNLLKSSQPLP